MTQKERILTFMKTNDGITSMDAFRLGCTRLAARISDLKRDGHRIESIRVTKGEGKDRKSFSLYRLEDGNGK